MKNKKDYKRRYKRLSTPFLIKILTYNHRRLDYECSTCAEGINISPNGISFKYPKVIEKGDHLRILLHDIHGLKTDEIMANIRIIWTETKDIFSNKFGGKFVRIAPENKYKLLKLVRTNNVKN